jgi:hypothetical protein
MNSVIKINNVRKFMVCLLVFRRHDASNRLRSIAAQIALGEYLQVAILSRMQSRHPTLQFHLWTLTLLLVPAISAADDVDWLIAPYVWLPHISLDQSVDSGGGGGGISASDLLSKTESAGMIRLEAARNRWGLTVDYIWLSLADQTSLEARPPLNIGIDVDGEVDLSVVEVGGFYRPTGDIEGVNYLLGVRQISADKTIVATPNNSPTQVLASNSDVTDIFLGGRYIYRIGERWDFSIRGDYSFGDSEGTLNLMASVGMRIAGPFHLQLGYRHAVIEYEDDVDGVQNTTEISLSGAYLGFVFRF